jgi:hypothetical protein
MVKDLFEDWKRHSQDKLENNRKIQVIPFKDKKKKKKKKEENIF